MAKKSTPTTNDPAALAFSAVEDALKDSVFNLDEPAAERPTAKQGRDNAARNDQQRTAEKFAAQTRSVANDDRFQSSKILYSLQTKPSARPTWLALAISVVWIVGVLFAGWSRFNALLTSGQSAGNIFASLDFIVYLSILVLPVLGFFAVSTLVRRAQDLRLAATSITHAALRLAEPETTAAEKVASVGQAVRREVNALGDGLERALSRAGELEVMIHNEVTALERTYSENESRMRALIQELASQREAVITNTDRVREAITESHTGLVFDLDMISQRIAGTIVESGGNLSRALETAGTTLHSGFGERTESFISLIDGRTTDLINALDDSAGRLNMTLEDRTSNISGAFESRTFELSSVIEGRMQALTEALDSRAVTLSDAIDNRTSSLAKLLSQGGITLLDQLRDRGHEVSGALDMIGSRISADITGRAREAENLLTTLTRQLDESVSIQINAMESRMQSAMIEISGQLDDTTEKARITIAGAGSETLGQFDSRVGDIAQIVDSRLQSLEGIIGDKGDRLINSLDKHNAGFAARANVLEMALDEKSGHFNDIVSQRTREMTETLGARAKQITEAIGNRSREMADSLEGHVNILSEAIDARTQEFDRTLSTRTEELSGALDTRTEQVTTLLDSRTQQIASVIGTRSTELSDALGMRTQQLSEALGSHTLGIANAIGDRTAELARIIDTQGTAARDKIEASLRGVTDTMADRANSVSSIIASKVAEVNDNLGRGIDNAIVRLADAESGVTARIDSAASTVGESARKAADIIETGVNSARKAITDMVDQRLGTLPEAITARADITAERLASLNTTINTALVQSMADLEAGADRIEETISTRIVAATANISTDVTATANRMDGAVRAALDQINAAASVIQDLVEVKAVNAAETLSTQIADINATVSSQTNAFAALVSEKSDQLNAALQSHGNVLREALGENAREAEAIMQVSTSRILTDVTAALGKLNDSNILLQKVLDSSTSNLANLETSVANQTATYSATVRDAIGSTEQAGKLVSEHVSALQNTIRSMVGEFGAILGNLNEETLSIDKAAQNLATTSSFTMDTLETRRAAMDTLASSFTARADDIDGRMRTFAQSIADTVNDTENRLLGARRAMEEALAATSGQVADALDATTSTLTGALTKNVSQVDALLAATAGKVDETIENASGRLRSVLSDTTNLVKDALEESGGRFNAVLDDTSKRMANVLDETGGRFNAVLDDTSKRVADAVSANTGSVSEALNATGERVAARLTELRTTAGTESQRADEFLRQTQKAMMEEMQKALEEATKRFNDTATAMRQTAKEVGSELEATRSELARGVMELPEETRASAAAMRRVVAEQIEALSELNAIVRAQPATHDLNDRQPPRAASEERQDSYREPPRSEPTRAEPVRTEPARPAPGPAFQMQPAPQRLPESRPVVEPRQQTDAPVAEAIRPGDDTNGGWLRDVLRNATAAQPGQGQITGLTEDITRAIDDAALADSWARYQAGEANVFSRRIYSLSGQQTYDEVRKRLQREPEFARTATAYIADFEQLLKRAAGGADPQGETRELLLSARGKVYTMLAHAAGRLG